MTPAQPSAETVEVIQSDVQFADAVINGLKHEFLVSRMAVEGTRHLIKHAVARYRTECLAHSTPPASDVIERAVAAERERDEWRESARGMREALEPFARWARWALLPHRSVTSARTLTELPGMLRDTEDEWSFGQQLSPDEPRLKLGQFRAILSAIRAHPHLSDAAKQAGGGWQPIETAPKDGTEFWALSDDTGGNDLPPFVSRCAWHPDAGFCTDELREPILWRPDLPTAPATKQEQTT